eukprot:XP_011615406.1 PREDICTED: fas-activated serine/threonine kinase isoform X2 [Takifugu rubripes]
MLHSATRWRLLSCQSLVMYATRLYGPVGGGGGGAGGLKQGRRTGVAMLEAPPPLQPHLSHHPSQPHTSYTLYSGRPDSHRGVHVHPHYHPQSTPLAPPSLLPHYQNHTHFHAYRGGAGAAGAAGAKKKTWNFIHEKMSYDTFFTMKRLIERSRHAEEVLRWITQNPSKISHNHYPVALQKIGQLLQAEPARGGAESAGGGGGAGGGAARHVLEHQDFQTLCDAIVNDCAKFDNFSIVNCLYAVAALGLPSDSQVVQVLEAESQSRLSQFNQKDLSMVFSSSMKLHPGSQHPLTEACLAGLEKNLERERHPQTLFLLLSYYRLKLLSLQPQEAAAGGDGGGGDGGDGGDGGGGPASSSTSSNPELLLANRKILRLVKHTLASVTGVRDQEMALLDEMLAACAGEASNKSLELIFSSHLFYQNRQEKFISRLAELPKKVDSITPYTMALVAKYVARHRLRDVRLLDTIADFLVKKAEYLDSKVIQKLVFPFSRMSYRPSNEQQFFSRLEEVVELKALSSPLATVNILMSLFQLGHFPGLVLHRVFSSAFISNVTNSPYALIVRRYLSLLDAAVGLEYREYSGPRLQDAHKVLMFDHALTADEVNRKYSYKGLVAEALRQLLGEHNYRQDQVLPPGYYTDFVLWMDGSGQVLPIRARSGLALSIVPPSCAGVAAKPADGAVATVTSEFQFTPFTVLEDGAEQPCQTAEAAGGSVESRSFLPNRLLSSPVAAAPPGPLRPGSNGGPLDYGSYYITSGDYYTSLPKEQSLESQDSSTLSSPRSESLAQPGTKGSPGAAATDSLFQFSIGKILEDEGGAGGHGNSRELAGFYEGVAYSEETGADPDPQSPPPLHSTNRPEDGTPPVDQEQVRRVIMSVNDKWHYCHNCEVLVGSRAMRDRHLRLLGYVIIQLPYHELEKLNGIEEVKQYLHKKLLDVPL